MKETRFSLLPEWMTRISVIIPVKNEERKIEQCLKAVLNQTLRPFEVLVVDGHSTDRTVENAIRFDVKIFYEDYHTRAGACQIGINNSVGEYIAFTDADCIPEADWLENLIEEFSPDIVGVGGGIRNIGEGLWERSISLVSETFLGSAYSVQGRFFKDKRYVNSISGCNSVYRKEDILKIGGFDVGLSTAEDAELNKRMLTLGKLLYTPKAIINHNHQRGLKDFAKRMYQYGYGRSTGRLWDIQVIPPVLALLTVVFLFVSLNAFLFMIALYVLILIFFDLKIVMSTKNIRYLASIPLVFVLEHIAYAAGFWLGFARRIV